MRKFPLKKLMFTHNRSNHFSKHVSTVLSVGHSVSGKLCFMMKNTKGNTYRFLILTARSRGEYDEIDIKTEALGIDDYEVGNLVSDDMIHSN